MALFLIHKGIGDAIFNFFFLFNLLFTDYYYFPLTIVIGISDIQQFRYRLVETQCCEMLHWTYFFSMLIVGVGKDRTYIGFSLFSIIFSHLFWMGDVFWISFRIFPIIPVVNRWNDDGILYVEWFYCNLYNIFWYDKALEGRLNSVRRNILHITVTLSSESQSKKLCHYLKTRKEKRRVFIFAYWFSNFSLFLLPIIIERHISS